MTRKIVLIGPAHPLRGGLASYNERLARQFQTEGYEVKIYTFSLQYPSFLFPGTSQFSEEPAPQDLNIKVCINSINPLNWWRIGHQLKCEQADIIVVRYWLPFMGPCLGTILRLARRSKKTKVVCIADNVIPHEKRPGDEWFTRYFVKAVDGFVTMSKKVLSDLTLFTNKPALQVVHPLYDNFGDIMPRQEAREKIGLPPSGKLVLFFGFIRKYKGLDLLFESIALLKQQGFFDTHQVQFVIAGEFYEPEAPYMKMIDELKIADHLILRNHFITDHEVKYYLNAADCVIQPYKQATQSGVTPLAYHFEKPMIVTNVGGLADMVPEHIGLVAEPTATSISKNIVDFFANDSAPFVAALHEEKKKYSWSNITGAIVSLANSH